MRQSFKFVRTASLDYILRDNTLDRALGSQVSLIIKDELLSMLDLPRVGDRVALCQYRLWEPMVTVSDCWCFKGEVEDRPLRGCGRLWSVDDWP